MGALEEGESLSRPVEARADIVAGSRRVSREEVGERREEESTFVL